MRRLLLLTCFVAGAAWADVTPPDTDGCSNRTEDATSQLYIADWVEPK